MINDIANILSNSCGLAGIFICIYKLIKIFESKDISDDWLNGIWLSGLIAFLIRLAGQMLNIADMFRAVSDANRPDINSVAVSLNKATLNILNGLIILIILLILWGLLKGLITYKRQTRSRTQAGINT